MYKEFCSNDLEHGFDDINFEVLSLPLYYENPNESTSLMMTNQVAIVRKDNGHLLSLQSEKYKLVKNTEIITKLDPFLDQGYSLNKLSNYDDKKFRFELVNESIKFDVSGYQTHPRMIIENSYDGTLSFKAIAGYYVQVYSNGATVGPKFYNINAKHIGKSFTSDFSAFDGNKVADMLSAFTLKKWEKQLEPEEVIEFKNKICRGIPDRNDDQPSYTKIQLENRYLREKDTITAQDEFAMFMAATNLATHGKKYGIPYSYMRTMEKNISEIFVNEFMN